MKEGGLVLLTDISIFLAFGAGVLSFVSPCVFPLYPAFLSYITGMSVSDIQSGKLTGQRKAIFHTIFFLLGFSIIYIVLGLGTTGSASLIETWYHQYGDLIRQLGAVLILLFGLITVGIFQIKFLFRDHKLRVLSRISGYIYRGLGLGTSGSACLIEMWYNQYVDLIRQLGAVLILLFG